MDSYTNLMHVSLDTLAYRVTAGMIPKLYSGSETKVKP